MAQQIYRYKGTASGDATFYWYKKPDATSKATRIYNGTKVILPLDYAQRIANSMYPIISPGNGWIRYWNVTDIQPEYKTVTDRCTPPSSVKITEKVLTISGGAGGDLNNFVGYGISWRERAAAGNEWGLWSTEEQTTATNVPVSANSGMVRQYRARTLGSAGETYYSEYALCTDLVSVNTQAGVPTILRPLDKAVTSVAKPAIRISCPPDPDGQTVMLQRSLDGGGGVWTDVGMVPAEGGLITEILPVGVGTHTLQYRLLDESQTGGDIVTITFTREERTWKRTIQTGDIICNEEISFVADIQEMVGRINEACAFYDVEPLVLPGEVGRFENWKKQLAAMKDAINKCRWVAGLPEYDSSTFLTAWPRAKDINVLRTVIENT